MLQCAPGYCLALPAAAAALSAAESVPQAAREGGKEGGREEGPTHSHKEARTHHSGSRRGKERRDQDRSLEESSSQKVRSCYILEFNFHAAWGHENIQGVTADRSMQNPHIHSRRKNSLAFNTAFSSYFPCSMRTQYCALLWHKFLIRLRELWVTGFLSLHWCEASQRSSKSEKHPKSYRLEHTSEFCLNLSLKILSQCLLGKQRRVERVREGG